MITCKGCPTSWTGLAMAHCPSCHDTFSTLGNFDKHRKGTLNNEKNTMKCVDPRTVGLVLRTTGATPTWAAPGDPDYDRQFGRVDDYPEDVLS